MLETVTTTTISGKRSFGVKASFNSFLKPSLSGMQTFKVPMFKKPKQKILTSEEREIAEV